MPNLRISSQKICIQVDWLVKTMVDFLQLVLRSQMKFNNWLTMVMETQMLSHNISIMLRQAHQQEARWTSSLTKFTKPTHHFMLAVWLDIWVADIFMLAMENWMLFHKQTKLLRWAELLAVQIIQTQHISWLLFMKHQLSTYFWMMFMLLVL